MPTGSFTAPPAPAATGHLTVAAPVVVDLQTRPLYGEESGGEATLFLPPPAANHAYRVEIIDIWSNSTDTPTAGVYLDSAAPQNELDYSANAGHDVAPENPAIYVPSGARLLVVFFGLSAGALVTARIQYAVLRFVPVSYGGHL